VTRARCARAPPQAGRLILCVCVRPEHADRRYSVSSISDNLEQPAPEASIRAKNYWVETTCSVFACAYIISSSSISS
jgi:hypothetical protein